MQGYSGSSIRELQITREFDAPRERVFDAWTNCKDLSQWWGPRQFSNPCCDIDPRPGGKFDIDMQGPDGTLYPSKGEIEELQKPSHLVFRGDALEDESGSPALEDITDVTFSEHDGKTIVNVRAVVVKATPEAEGALAGMEQGWTESLDRLEDYLEGKPVS